MAKPYRLGKEVFATKDDIEAHVSAILNAGPIGSEVTGRDALILYDLLALRADKLAEIGNRKVLGFERGMQPGPFSRTRCFWAILEDGTKLDVSVYKAIRQLSPCLPKAPSPYCMARPCHGADHRAQARHRQLHP